MLHSFFQKRPSSLEFPASILTKGVEEGEGLFGWLSGSLQQIYWLGDPESLSPGPATLQAVCCTQNPCFRVKNDTDA